ncbi:MAG: CoA-transferase [Acidobacteriota bacterium]|jgi:acyl CoA:acetate/3-ketoacid CoA transferase alpha subunit/acyl CoA:acetate/3-ketoacid CoA transferase beta subunit
MSKLVDLTDLVAAIPDGVKLALGGFQLSRVPVALLRALTGRGARDLSVLSGPNPLALDLLAATGALRAADCGFIGLQYEDGFVTAPALRRTLAAGAMRLRQRDVFDTIEELRAAARDDAPVADFALLHAQRADAAGNLEIDDPVLDVLLAAASGAVLATVEEVVERIARPTIPAGNVAAVAVARHGASPSACFGHYRRDADGVRAWLGDSAPSAADPAPPGAADRDRVDAYVVNLARQVHDGETIVTGLASAVPMLAITLAQRTHAPRARYINCIGAVNPRIERAWATSVEPELLHDCGERIGLADIFDRARAGDIDGMFFGAAQVDRGGAINLERIGPQEAPSAWLPGPAGSPSMRSWVRRVLIGVPRQSPRNLVARVDAATSVPSRRNEETVLVTDLALWHLRDGALVPTGLTAGTDSARLSSATGFAVDDARPAVVAPPSDLERASLQHIDAAGLRYRLLARRLSSRSSSRETEKVLHER